MINVRHAALFALSGLIWFAVGLFLLTLGLNFLNESLVVGNHVSYPMIDWMLPYFGNRESAVLTLIAAALAIGYFKGRFVLGKSAKKGIERIYTFPNPTALKNIYSAKYYILLALMMGLGLLIKYLGVPTDIRGLVDVAIGAALINGSMFYFRACLKRSIYDN